MDFIKRICLVCVALIGLAGVTVAQVNTVEFGKSRVQYKKLKWKFYQSPNFNTYVAQNGTELGKFAAQVAEEELNSLENTIEYSLQRRANIIIYNDYNDYKASNVGLGVDWQSAGGLTKLVNNKLVIYFDGNHNNLRGQIREGIARVLTDNMLFGDDIGEFASNQALLDLPKWLTDGYVAYNAENWSTAKDDELKSAILSGNYNTFYQFAFEKPLLAGHSFWHFMAERYKPESVSYFLYLARMYKNLNAASQRITKKRFKEVLAEFMDYQGEKYSKDIRQRRNQPKGQVVVSEDVSKNEYVRFQVNPNPRNGSYAVVEFKKGIYRINLYYNSYDAKVLYKYGVRTNLGDINPNYPIMAWDGKGQRLLVIYKEGKRLKMFVYDVIAKYKRYKQDLPEELDQITDASFMLDANTIVMSAVKNGHTDIFTYKIEEQKLTQITDDIYDDLDPTFVSFADRSGIIYASNRPSPDAVNSDTVLPSRNRFNIFLVDALNTSKQKQITKLTDNKFGNARYPMQYNTTHFTFVSDENGIGNRWAGFFSTKRNGVDTLFFVGEDMLRNPGIKELDSTLNAWQKQEPDSIGYVQVFKDSTYTFPLTNYQSTLLETRIAGNNGQVSELRREGDYKFLYKLKVDEQVLDRRNVNARPTDFMKRQMDAKRAAEGKAMNYSGALISGAAKETKKEAVFQSEFENENEDSLAAVNKVNPEQKLASVLTKTKLFNYRMKFSADYILSGFTNNILINRYQAYGGGSGPIQLNNGNDFNWTFRVGVSDLMEDVKFVAGLRFGFDLRDKDIFMSYQNYRKRLDWGFTYYRSNVTNFSGFFQGVLAQYSSMLFTNIYQGNINYPLNETKSIRVTAGLRTDRGVVRPMNNAIGAPDQFGLATKDSVSKYGLARLEYVHDNSINPTMNIWNGLRWKVYLDVNMPVGEKTSAKGRSTFNLGFDGRYYHKIYRNFIWAGRAAADISWGGKKIIYYLGGVDGWLGPKFNNQNRPAPDQEYAFQSLAVNMRGYQQNVANGNNAFVINSEFRLPIITTFFNRPINNAFLRNLQLIQFIDLGTAWNGKYNGIKRPGEVVNTPGSPVVVRLDAGGLGPFAGGYGFGLRSTLLGYFMKVDAAWPMKGIFKGSPVWYFALGLDF